MAGRLTGRIELAMQAARIPMQPPQRHPAAPGRAVIPVARADGAAGTAIRVGDLGGLLGILSVDSGSASAAGTERRQIGSSSVFRLRTQGRLLFRRTWSHVRDDRTDVALLCLPRAGGLRLTHSAGECIAHAGDLLMVRSSVPFCIETTPGAAFEMLTVAVPAHRLRQAIGLDIAAAACVAVTPRPFRLAQRVLADLVDDCGELSGAVAGQLVDVLLALLADALKRHVRGSTPAHSIGARRLDDVLRHIDQHLSDPELNAASAARACGISPRYLSALLKRNRTPFAALVRGKRLEAARQWLATSGPAEASVSSIAYRVGFKSHAHFSRMFRRHFRISPSGYRAGAGLARTAQPAVPLLSRC